MADFLGLMKQAAELKTKMEAMQAELDKIEVEGAAGGGMVKVRMTAKGEVKAVTLDPSLMKPEEVEIAEDLIVAAHGDARRKAEATLQDKMKSLTGDLPLPPGLKLF
jgi:nucleoid-associated protein EbfC